MIGLTGANGTGKSTLAKAFAQAHGVPFMATSASDVFRCMGLDPKAEYPMEMRLVIQEMILGAFELQYAAAEKLSRFWIADRTPIDLASYLLADVQRSGLLENPKQAEMVNNYVRRCFDVASRHFSIIILVQPGIEVPLLREGKAPSCPAYMEHLNALQLGLLCDDRNMTRRFSIPRRVTALEDRLSAVNNVVASVVKADEVLQKSRVTH